MGFAASVAGRKYNQQFYKAQLQSGQDKQLWSSILNFNKTTQSAAVVGGRNANPTPDGKPWSLQAMPLDNFRFVTVRQKLLCFIGKTWTKAHIGLTLLIWLLYVFCSLVFQFGIWFGWTFVQV